MSLLKNKIDFAVIFQVKHANPNGDPLNGNRPRTTYESYGEVSDVCIKRKMRDRLIEQGHPILVQSNDRKNDDAISIKDRVEKTLKKDQPLDAKNACETWFDVRAFGQVFAFSKSKGKGTNKSADGVSIGIRGPVSIHTAFSVEPVDVTSVQITKSVNSEGDGTKKGSDTMGMKHRIEGGIFSFYGAINPQLAERTGFSEEDAEAIKNVLPKLFENDASSARPEGSMRVLKVFWWKHNCKAGQYSSAQVHQSLKTQTDGSFELETLDGLEAEILEGF